MNKARLFLILLPMKFFISCGEVSGDIHAAGLVRELKKLMPNARFTGIGGENLRKEGVEVFLDIKEMGVIGLIEAIKSLPKTLKHLKLAEEKARESDCCIFVDYPGFNLQLGKRTHRMGKKNIYYILPQIWAWGKSRVKTLRENFDLLISIIPFEEEYFKKHGVTVHYVGSPVLDKVLQEAEHLPKIEIPENKKVIGILPGSRRSEVERLLPHIRSIIEIMNKKRNDLFFVLSRRIPYTLDGPANVLLYDGHPYSLMKTANVLLVASGTATLETAIFEKPMVVFYKTSVGTYLAGKLVAKVKHLSLVNLIAGEEVVPEFVQKIDNHEIADRLLAYLDNPEFYRETVLKLREVKNKLKPNAASKAAKIIFEEVVKDGHAGTYKKPSSTN